MFFSRISKSAPVALSVLSIALALIYVRSSPIIIIGSLGFFSSLTSVYIIGFASCLVAIVVASCTGASRGVFAIQILIMESYLWILPLVMMPGLRFPASGHDLFFYSTTASISLTGHLNPATYVYQSWPLPYIFAAIMKIFLPSVSYLQMYYVTPSMMNLLVALLVYCFFGAYLSEPYRRMAVIGVALFELYNYTEQFTTVSPFSFASMLFYAFTLTMLISWARGGATSMRQFVIFLVFLASISASHPVIAIEMVLATAAVYFGYAIRHKSGLGISLSYFVIGAMMVALWTIYAGASLFDTYATSVLSTLFNLVSGVLAPPVSALGVAASSHLLVDHAKLVVLAFIVGAAIPSLVLQVKKRNPQVMLLLYFLVGIGLSAIVVGGAEGSSFYILLLCAALPVLILLDIMSVSKAPRSVGIVILLLVMVVSPLASTLVLYGNVGAESVSQPTIIGSNYYSNYLRVPGASNYYTLTELPLIGYYGPNLDTIIPFSNPGLWNPAGFQNPTTQFVVLGSDAATISRYQYGNTTQVTESASGLDSNSNWLVLYSSSYIIIYGRD